MSGGRRTSRVRPVPARDRQARRAALPATEHLHPLAEELHLCDSLEIVQRLHDADHDAVAAVGRVSPEIAAGADGLAQTIAAGGRVFYVGAGTSGRLGALDAAELSPTFGLPRSRAIPIIAGGARALMTAVEGAEDDTVGVKHQLTRRRLSERDLVIGISASGSTPFVVAALAEGKRVGARTILICNAARPQAKADLVIAPLTGPELVAGSTRLKAGTATKLVLNALSTAAMVRLGKVFRGRMIDVQPTNAKLRERAQRIVTELAGVTPAHAKKALIAANWDVRLAVETELERVCGVQPTQPAKSPRARRA